MAAADLAAELDALKTELANSNAERDAALAREAALAEVLQTINSSPGDLATVFDAMLERALKLSETAHGLIWRWDGAFAHAASVCGDEDVVALIRQIGHHRPDPGSSLGQIIDGANLVCMADPTQQEAYRTSRQYRAFIDAGGIRTSLMVALRKDGVLLGALAVYRQEVRPFTEKQIAVLQNFAEQAVIAMENARLLTETREALEQQTATAEVLQVINSSPGDLAPVFEAILEKAHSLCGAALGSLGIFEGETWRAVVQRGYGEPLASRLRQGFRGSDPPWGRALLDGAPFVHVANLAQVDHPIGRANVAAGVHTLLLLPLRKHDALLGTISIARREVRPFSDKEIALLENFAAQAVTAMENARLLTETREALEQQTATAKVLQVINSSPGDLAPVFDAMLDKALQLCGAAFGNMTTWDGEYVHHVASRGASAELTKAQRRPFRPVPGSNAERILRGETVVSASDLREEEAYRVGAPGARVLVDLGGARSHASVALRKDGELLGAISIYRQEVRPFTDKQIALLQNFAAQAVIAMENARLLTETREALEQQTATAEVLQVINSSPGELAPVFDAILQKAGDLCGVAYGSLELYDGENFRAVATVGFSEAFAELLAKGYPAAEGLDTRTLVEGARYSHILDQAEIDTPMNRSAVELDNHHTLLCVPLRREGQLLGMIASAR